MIPDRERGYSIEPDTAIVHERYQDHAPRAMRTSAAGVSEYAKGREPIPCEVCFPKAVKAKGKAKAGEASQVEWQTETRVMPTPVDLNADGGQVTPVHLRETFGLPPLEPDTESA